FSDESFNGIWACASLLHLERTETPAVLASFYRILKPGGILFVLVKEGVGKKLVRGGMLGSKRRFFTFFPLQTVRTLVTESGFLVEDIYTWNQKDRWSERPSQVWISCFAKKP
ncbi:MAG: class I SAM-dependent methyltransferase, partial [Candidatus Gottesmanbacteria bacterium]|nr:class I SAM-dependent methyltransferase [Candidatus Gottesmanbacteria bacterium]